MKSDLDLLAEFRRGETPAFQKLIRRHHVTLYNFFLILSENTIQAERLARQTFLQILRELRAQRQRGAAGRSLQALPGGSARFNVYLYSVAYVNWKHHGSALQACLPPPASASISSNSLGMLPAPAAGGNPREPVPQMPLAAVPVVAESANLGVYTSLPLGLRAALALHEIAGLHYGEIAAALGLPRPEIQQQITAALALLAPTADNPAPTAAPGDAAAAERPPVA